MMTKYLAGVLSVIAAGTLLIAYGLLNPRVTAAGGALMTQPMYPADRVQLVDQGSGQGYGYAPAYGYAPQRLAYPVSDVRSVPIADNYPAPRRAPVARPVSYQQERPARVVTRAPRRDWARTAMIIGGSSAAGAGLGAIFGGRKGALIGAAIGGGASTVYEIKKR
jgi:hypothetical protein